MSDAENTEIIEGLAAIANGLAEMGESDEEIRRHMRGHLARRQITTEAPAVLRAAAECITRMPQPLLESAEETERRRPIEEMLGLTSAEDQLAAMLRAREVLENLARDFEG